MDLCTNITFWLVSSVLGFQVAKWFFRYSSDANFGTGFDKLWSTEATQGGYSYKQALHFPHTTACLIMLECLNSINSQAISKMHCAENLFS